MQYAKAMDYFRRALEIQPNHAAALNNLGSCYLEQGQIEEAVACYKKVLSIQPDFAEATTRLAYLSHYTDSDTQVNAEHIKKFLASKHISDKETVHFHFALGMLYDNDGEFDEAFHHFSQGNTLRRKALHFDPAAHIGYITRLIAAYSERFFEHDGATVNDSEQPVLIVGMPRSGTTLVEQILSSHPQVGGAGNWFT